MIEPTGGVNPTSSAVPDGVVDKVAGFLDNLEGFEKALNGVMKEVASGNLDRLPDALVMATQFDLAINFVVQIRNRLMEGFQEFMRITM